MVSTQTCVLLTLFGCTLLLIDSVQSGGENGCYPGEIRCANAYFCIHPDYICDGVNDCGDNSDEYQCSAHECYPGEVRCTNKYFCVPPNNVCDGVDDCGDNSDELHCDDDICSRGEFRCEFQGKSVCHPNFYKCDGEPDCDDLSDEIGCKVGKRSRTKLMNYLTKSRRLSGSFY